MATKTAPVITDEGIDIGSYFGEGQSLWEGYTPPQPMEPIPAGTYDATVELVEGPMQNNAGDGYNMKFTFVVDVPEDERTRKLFMYVSLKETARWKVQQTFSALGKEPGENMYIPGEFDNQPCRLQVGVRGERPKDDGTDEKWPASNEVKKVLPPRREQLDDAWL